MKYIITLLLALLIVASPSVADDRSGPGRRTILREGWGTVFFAPEQVKGDYELTINEDGDRYSFKSDQGLVEIEENQEDVKIHYPDLEASVEFEPESLVVTWGDDVHRFERDGPKMTYKGPQGQVEFVRGEGEMTITGPRGTVTLSDREGEYLVKSPAGETRFTTLPSGFRISGVRLSEHPYLRRGALFSHDGVGVYVELALLDPKNPLFRFLDWGTIEE
jgi:hypothetical protein